jgi:hypothetical protein
MDTRAGEAAHAYVGSLVFSVSHVIVKDVSNAVTAHWKINGPTILDPYASAGQLRSVPLSEKPLFLFAVKGRRLLRIGEERDDKVGVSALR